MYTRIVSAYIYVYICINEYTFVCGGGGVEGGSLCVCVCVCSCPPTSPKPVRDLYHLYILHSGTIRQAI